MRMKNHFQIKGGAHNLVSIQRPGETRRWPIVVTTKGPFTLGTRALTHQMVLCLHQEYCTVPQMIPLATASNPVKIIGME